MDIEMLIDPSEDEPPASDRRARDRQRRQRRLLAAAVAGVLALAGLAAYALRHPPSAAPVAGPSHDVLFTTEPPPPRASPTPAPVPAGAVDLNDVSIQLPPRPDGFEPCQGAFTFVHNVARSPALDLFTLYVERELVADVNHDGTPDTVAVIRCESDVDAGLHWQVIAVDPGALGTVQVIGSVLADDAPRGPGALFDVAVTADGTIVAEVGDFAFDTRARSAILDARQHRSYGWVSGRFVQVGGPTAFPLNPNSYDLGVSSSGLTLTPAGSGRAGTMSVTVTNLGPAAAINIVIELGLPRSLPAGADGLQACATGPTDARSTVFLCVVDRLPPGGQRTVTIAYTDLDPAAVEPAIGSWIIAVWGEDQFGTGASMDPVRDNDQIVFQVRAT